MTHWMCTSCGYYLQSAVMPDRCPSCRQASAFNNVTCCRPDCGGEQNIDPLLVGTTLRTLTGVPKPTDKSNLLPLSTEPLPVVEILRGLDDQEKRHLIELGRVEHYESNVVIVKEGAEAQTFYLVEEGQVTVESQLTRGRLFPISIISVGQAFGWSALVPPYLYRATVVTQSKAKVVAIDRAELLHRMQTDTSFGLKIMQNVAATISARLRSMELALMGLLQSDR